MHCFAAAEKWLRAKGMTKMLGSGQLRDVG
jgi:hypothetical protein